MGNLDAGSRTQRDGQSVRSPRRHAGTFAAIGGSAAALLFGEGLVAAAAVAGSAAALLSDQGVAGAACAGGHLIDAGCYWWAGKGESTQNWYGVAAGISLPSESIPNDTQFHIGSYVDMNQDAANCPFTFLGMPPQAEPCWIQIGNTDGITDTNSLTQVSYCQVDSPQIYVEVNDVNSYDCTEYKGTITIGSDDFYSEYFNGSCNPTNDEGEISAYVYNGTSTYLIGNAWLYDCGSSTTFAQSELEKDKGATGMPSIAQYEGFGGSPYPIEVYNNATWSDWVTSPAHGPDSPLQMYPDVTNSDTFLTWG